MPFQLPPATRNLLIANVAIFLLQQVMGDTLLQFFALWPWGPDQLLQSTHGIVAVGFRPWQMISYAFLHGSVLHVGANMFGLLMFGGIIERSLGTRNFLIYYFACAITAALAQLLVAQFWVHDFYPTLGASGAIFGILLAFGMLYPHEKMLIFPIPIPLPAWLLVTGYALFELIAGLGGFQADVAHFAHLGGMLGGIVLIQYWRGRLPIKPKRVLR